VFFNLFSAEKNSHYQLNNNIFIEQVQQYMKRRKGGGSQSGSKRMPAANAFQRSHCERFLNNWHAEIPQHRVARFFLVQNTKTGKIYQITTNYTNCPLNITKDRKIYTNLDIWFENKPSGNPTPA
jgi:hypothetical protein